MNLLEEFALLAHDERGARIVDTTRVDNALGGAVLMELALAERIDVADKKVVVLGREPLGDPVLDEALARIADEPKGRKPGHWVGKLAKGARDSTLRRLVEAEVLQVERSKVLAVFPRTRFPSAYGTEPVARTEARQRIRAAILREGAVEPRTAALCALVAATEMERKLFADLDRKLLKARLKEISEGDWAADAVRRTIQDVQAAMVVVIAAGGDGGGGDGGGGGGGS